jgi:hypothetical protein
MDSTKQTAPNAPERPMDIFARSRFRECVREPRTDVRMVSRNCPAMRYGPAETVLLAEFADLPADAYEELYSAAQIHVDGKFVRVKRKWSNEWTHLYGSVSGAIGKSRVVQVCVCGNTYYMHRLVAEAYLEPVSDDSGRNEVCHILRRVPDRFPPDGASNLYFGTHTDNVLDTEPHGKPKPGFRRYFRGIARGGEDWTYFETQEQAASKAGVGQASVSRALSKIGKEVGKDLWRFEWNEMTFEDGEIVETLEGEKKFVTNFGRVGEVKRVDDGFGNVDDVCVECILDEDGNGYVRAKFKKFSTTYLHRIIALVFMKEEIAEAERESCLSFEKLFVAHVNGIENDNRVSNLRVVTRQERNEKDARAVVELDDGGKVVSTYKSIHEASRAIDVHARTVHSACMELQKIPDANFAFKREFENDETPARKRSKTRENLEKLANGAEDDVEMYQTEPSTYDHRPFGPKIPSRYEIVKQIVCFQAVVTKRGREAVVARCHGPPLLFTGGGKEIEAYFKGSDTPVGHEKVSACLNGKRKHAHGMIFELYSKYLDDTFVSPENV